jgi:hypothetical protein
MNVTIQLSHPSSKFPSAAPFLHIKTSEKLAISISKAAREPAPIFKQQATSAF